MSFKRVSRKSAITLLVSALALMGLQFVSAQTASANAFTISSSSETASVGTPIVGYTLTSYNIGSVYTISPAAGNGLNFNIATGTLTGTPIAAAPLVSYTITEMSPGFPTQTYDVTVNAATTPIFNLSSSSEIATAGTAITGYTIASLGTPITGYTIAPAVSNGLSFDTSTGLLSGTPLAAHSLISYTITATDGVNTAFQAFDLTVNAAVPTTPAFTLSSVSESVFIGSPIVGYNINSTGDAITSFSISPSVAGTGLSFSTITGLLSGTPLNAGAGNSYTITAHDAAAHTASQNFILLVSAPVPTTPVITLSHSSEIAIVGVPIVGYTISSTGDAVTAYSISPAISNNLSFDTTTGLISGTPLAAAPDITYTITAHDAAAHTYGRTFDLTVNLTSNSLPDPAQQDSIASFYPSTLQAHVPNPQVTFSGYFPQQIVAAQVNGTIVADGAIANLSPTMVVITIPTQNAGTAEIQLFDGDQPLLGLVEIPVADVRPAPLKVSPHGSSAWTVVAGNPVSITLDSSGGTGPLKFSITNGQLPAGITLDPATGAISGVASEGASTATITVTDSLGATAWTMVSVVVKPALLKFSSPTIDLSAVVGAKDFTYSPDVTGGTGPYDFTLNKLPAPLVLTSSGFEIPAASLKAGKLTFYFHVEDSKQNIADQTVNLTITAPLAISSPADGSTATGKVGIATVLPIAITGGEAPVNYSVDFGDGGSSEVGTFPASQSASVSHTWVGSGTYTVTITATDAKGVLATRTISYKVAERAWVSQKLVASKRSYKIIAGASSGDGRYLAAAVYKLGIFTSSDSGASWQQLSSAPTGSYDVATSDNCKYLAAIVLGGDIYTSTNFGVTWLNHVGTKNDTDPQKKNWYTITKKLWYGITSSADGKYLAAVVRNGDIYTSADFGKTWIDQVGTHQGLVSTKPAYNIHNKNWYGITSSADGKYLAAVAKNGDIATSSDYGANWVDHYGYYLDKDAQSVNWHAISNKSWVSVSMSNSGKYIVAADLTGDLFTSSDFGDTWQNRLKTTSKTVGSWQSVTVSGNGKFIAAVRYLGNIFISEDFGKTWKEFGGTKTDAANPSSVVRKNWWSITSNYDGSMLVAYDGAYNNVWSY